MRPGVAPSQTAPAARAGGMSLTLSPEELEARRAVALPYELQRVRS